MNIGEASKQSGIDARLIRHYESIGIVPRAGRTVSGYRSYTPEDVHILRFVKKARKLGFSMKDIQKLVNLWRNKKRSSSEVKDLALKHVAEMEDKERELHQIITALKHLADACHGDHRPDCPILDELER